MKPKTDTDELQRHAREYLLARSNELRAAIGESANTELERIDNAIRRIDADMFAICDRCGGEIEEARLDAVPYATQCGDCARAT